MARPEPQWTLCFLAWTSQSQRAGQWSRRKTLFWCWRFTSPTWLRTFGQPLVQRQMMGWFICFTWQQESPVPPSCASSSPWRRVPTWRAVARTLCTRRWRPCGWSPSLHRAWSLWMGRWWSTGLSRLKSTQDSPDSYVDELGLSLIFYLAVELSSLAFYTQRQLSLCMLCFQKCQRHFISLWKFLYFSTEATCPIFMDPPPAIPPSSLSLNVWFRVKAMDGCSCCWLVPA